MRMRAPESLRAFVERHGIPFATTTMAKGLIDEDHALAIGCIERANRQAQRALLRSADLIIGLGYDTVEVEYEAWAGNVPVLNIDIELADGRKISGRADFGKGSPANPMSDDELANKFRECAAWGGLSQASARKIIDLVFNLEKLKHTRDLTTLLAIGGRRKTPARAKK